ncbi:HNH/endonuclease VII fold toxin-2 domain-containing protein, partial [Pseudomonas aeruginosa]
KGRGGKVSVPHKAISNHTENKAPCVGAEGVNQNVGTHGLMHTIHSAAAAKSRTGTRQLSNVSSISAKKTTYGTAKRQPMADMGKASP